MAVPSSLEIIQAAQSAVRSEDAADYFITKPGIDGLIEHQDNLIAQALAILDSRLKQPGQVLGSPEAVKSYLRIKLFGLEHEVFTVLFLDVKNRLIVTEELFQGTLTHTSVYPREVVKAALKHNAASVILAHNHPSGVPAPSASDLELTKALKAALALVDIRTLDHVIVAGAHTHSFAEHGEI